MAVTRYAKVSILVGALAAVASSPQSAQTTAPTRTILAIGAHAGDMELTAGALLIKQHKLGDRVVILHMTLGEVEIHGCRRRCTERRSGERRSPPTR